MKRFLSIALSAVLSITALTAAGAPAARAAEDWRCAQRSFSTPPALGSPTGWGHGFMGKSASGTSVHYWMMEKIHFLNGTVEYRFDSAFRFTCDPAFLPIPVTLTPLSADGEPPCTSPGNYAEVVDGKIVEHQLIGSKASITYRPFAPYWFTVTYRYWHTMRQDSPGQWRWHDSSVASCWAR